MWILFGNLGAGIAEPPNRNCFGINFAVFLCVIVFRHTGSLSFSQETASKLLVKVTIALANYYHRSDLLATRSVFVSQGPCLRKLNFESGGFQTQSGGLLFFFGKAPDCVADPFRNVPCRCSNRPRKRKGPNAKISGKSGKSRKDRENPKKDKKKDMSRSGSPPFEPPPSLTQAALKTGKNFPRLL